MHPSVANLFDQKPLTFIAGPCVIESLDLCSQVAEALLQLTEKYPFGVVFKASYDKANRSAKHAFRGLGMQEGLSVLSKIKTRFGLPILTDVHECHQVDAVAEVADILQIPAFLCRQTDLIVAVGETGKPINIKKGQFLSPEQMPWAVEKYVGAGGKAVAVTERGSCFGYGDLVVDMRGLARMRQALPQAAVVFDATHSVQRPGAGHGETLGDRNMALVLARAAVAVGVHGIFAEVHPQPDRALSDAATCLDFGLFAQLLEQSWALHRCCQHFAA